MSAEEQFWHWFLRHENDLFHFEREQESTFDRLSMALSRVDGDLSFEFGPARDGMREFVISASGLRRAFPAVERLYHARPDLSRFHVTAFRPRRSFVSDIKLAGATIAGKDVHYKLCRDEDPEKVGILLFLPGYSEDRKARFRQIGYLFLDEALGEYDVETKVGFIEMMGHDSEHFAGAFPIKSLADEFDALLRSKREA